METIISRYIKSNIETWIGWDCPILPQTPRWSVGLLLWCLKRDDERFWEKGSDMEIAVVKVFLWSREPSGERSPQFLLLPANISQTLGTNQIPSPTGSLPKEPRWTVREFEGQEPPDVFSFFFPNSDVHVKWLDRVDFLRRQNELKLKKKKSFGQACPWWNLSRKIQSFQYYIRKGGNWKSPRELDNYQRWNFRCHSWLLEGICVFLDYLASMSI